VIYALAIKKLTVVEATFIGHLRSSETA